MINFNNFKKISILSILILIAPNLFSSSHFPTRGIDQACEIIHDSLKNHIPKEIREIILGYNTKLILYKELSTHEDVVTSIVHDPTGKFFLSASWDKTIKILDANNGDEIKTLSGHTFWINMISISSDGNYLASSSMDKTIKIWNLDKGNEIQNISCPSFCISYCPNSNYIITTDVYDRKIKIFDTTTGREIRNFKHNYSGRVLYSQNGKLIASSDFDGKIIIWDSETYEFKTYNEKDIILRGDAMAFAKDEQYLAFGSLNFSVKILNLKTNEVKTCLGHCGSITAIAFSPDDKIIASNAKDYSTKLWDVKTVQELHHIPWEEGYAYSISFLPIRGIYNLVIGSANGKVQIFILIQDNVYAKV